MNWYYSYFLSYFSSGLKCNILSGRYRCGSLYSVIDTACPWFYKTDFFLGGCELTELSNICRKWSAAFFSLFLHLSDNWWYFHIWFDILHRNWHLISFLIMNLQRSRKHSYTLTENSLFLKALPHPRFSPKKLKFYRVFDSSLQNRAILWCFCCSKFMISG